MIVSEIVSLPLCSKGANLYFKLFVNPGAPLRIDKKVLNILDDCNPLWSVCVSLSPRSVVFVEVSLARLDSLAQRSSEDENSAIPAESTNRQRRNKPPPAGSRREGKNGGAEPKMSPSQCFGRQRPGTGLEKEDFSFFCFLELRIETLINDKLGLKTLLFHFARMHSF